MNNEVTNNVSPDENPEVVIEPVEVEEEKLENVSGGNNYYKTVWYHCDNCGCSFSWPVGDPDVIKCVSCQQFTAKRKR